MVEEQVIFNGDLLRFKSLEDYAAFKDMYDLVNNKGALQGHLESYKLYMTDPPLLDEESEVVLRELMSDGINSALNHFGGLTIVSLCTTYEMAAKEFLFCFFAMNPRYIYEFIGPDDAKGHVSLKEVLKVDSYKDLLASLAKKAASAASKGKYSQILMRIAQLCREDFDKEIAKKLDNLQSERNMIVHEKYSKEWLLKDIQNAEMIVSEVIEQICHYGVRNNIPGYYTCISSENTVVIQSVAVLTNKDI